LTITICDVGPRDGLQNEQRVLPPTTRAELCTRLLDAGLPTVEAISFVRNDRVPAMAGAEEVLAALPPNARSRCAALVLNHRGLQRALAADVDEVHVVVAASDEFARRNQGTSRDEGVRSAEAIVKDALASGIDRVRVVIAVAFGCPIEGEVDQGVVAAIAGRLAQAGSEELVVADTIGVAAPREVGRLCTRLMDLGVRVGVHPHDTRNTGAANAWAAVEAGATLMESSVGGLGGCPFAPGATGNLATEDLVYLLERAGITTGIDFDGLCQVVRWLEGVLGRTLPGRLSRAGPAPRRQVGARSCP
jgi:hydroxymethylglutaryl-CoA lyase/(R)-citramalyl-CoA lyase